MKQEPLDIHPHHIWVAVSDLPSALNAWHELRQRDLTENDFPEEADCDLV